MKLRTDNRARLYARDVLKPNTDYQAETDGNRIILVEMVPKPSAESRPAKVRLEKRGGYTVGVTDRVVTQEEVRKALDEFP